jgi:hypothetical protein
LSQSIGRRGADRSGAANDHVPDRRGGLTKIMCGDDFEAMRQAALFDEAELIAGGIEGNGAAMP